MSRLPTAGEAPLNTASSEVKLAAAYWLVRSPYRKRLGQSAHCHRRTGRWVAKSSHPFAGGGGGFRFEYEVAVWFAVEMLLSRLSELGGVVEALQFQAGPPGFDDLQLQVELPDLRHRNVSIQSRSRQLFTPSDLKFRGLLMHAFEAVRSDRLGFESGERRLAIGVGATSPGHAAMSQLCDLARNCQDVDSFLAVVASHGGAVQHRWESCVATDTLSGADLHLVLKSTEVMHFDLSGGSSFHTLELVNRLADGWDPRNLRAAAALADALRAHLASVGAKGGTVDVASLQRDLGSALPPNLGADTRRSKLARLKAAAHAEVVQSLQVIGLDLDSADRTAALALLEEPQHGSLKGLSVLEGDLGVGKTTEAHRLHLRAIELALTDPSAPAPLLLHARDLLGPLPISTIEAQAGALGDVLRFGVHLVVDGVDEVAVSVEELAGRLASIPALWPGSTVVLVTRPQGGTGHLSVVQMPSMSATSADALMKLIDPTVRVNWVRSELREALCRPLFAIRYALNHRQRNYSANHEPQLVESIGLAALRGLEKVPDAPELLGRLACMSIDSGGKPIDLRDLGVDPWKASALGRSRVLRISDGSATFQLAVLVEWFAALEILRDSALLQRIAANPVTAYRWRFALVQALTQATPTQSDHMLATMFELVPGLAAWCVHQAEPSGWVRRTSPPATSAEEAGNRIRRALEVLTSIVPASAALVRQDGKPLPIGVALNDARLLWLSYKDTDRAPLTVLPPDFNLRGSQAIGFTRATEMEPSPARFWPWILGLDHLREDLANSFETLGLVAELEECRPEVTWAYSKLILGLAPSPRALTLPVSDIEQVVDHIRQAHPGGDVLVRRNGQQWRVSEATAFVEDLRQAGTDAVAPPWPAEFRVGGGAVWDFWTVDELIDRLNRATKQSLDVYKAIVDRHFPALAAELSTYQLLPARFVGGVSRLGPDNAAFGPSFTWHLEPLEEGTDNAATWELEEEERWPGPDDDWFRDYQARVANLRGQRAALIRPTLHQGDFGIYSPTPASGIAIQLLHDDLAAHNWLDGAGRSGRELSAVRPRGYAF